MRIGLFTEDGCDASSSLGATVDALLAHRPGDLSLHQFSAPAGLAAFASARQLIQRAESDRLDALQITSTGPAAIIAITLSARFGLPVLGAFEVPAVTASGLVKTYLRLLIRQTRRLLVASLAARAGCIQAGVPASKIIVWRPGVDSSLFAPSKRSEGLRERWGVSAARPAVIYAGKLTSARGALLLQSMEAALHRTRPMHQLIVVGDGPARNELQARCPNAIFMGTMPRTEMPSILASADLCVCPSESSSTQLVVLEAQAAGLPVVVMQRGSARERANDDTAIVCRAPADFIVETAALIRNDVRRRSMGFAARSFAMTQEWGPGLTSIYAEYRGAAASSRVRRDLKPAFIPQDRRF